MNFPYRRIAVVGTTSSGKSTLADETRTKNQRGLHRVGRLLLGAKLDARNGFGFFHPRRGGDSGGGLGGGGELSPRPRFDLGQSRVSHLAELPLPHRFLASAQTHHSQGGHAGGIVEWQPREILGTSEIMV